MNKEQSPTNSLKNFTLYFLKLGYTGFGGPVALIGHMHRDLVEKYGWFTEEEYKEGLTLSQLAPGPMATQLAIYLGFIRYGYTGATIAVAAFVLPAFLMVVALGMVYKTFNGLPWMQSVFYGVGASVIGIIAISSYKLTIRSVGKFNLASFRQHWLLWLFYVALIIITLAFRTENVWLCIVSGIIYMLIKTPPVWLRKPPVQSILLLTGTGFWDFNTHTLWQMAWFFIRAGTFVFGGGMAIVAFLHGAVTDYHWIDEHTFVDAVAVAIITPGPVIITVAFIGYLTAGFPGACVAAFFTFLPCYVFTVIPAPHFKRYAKHTSIQAFVQGITAAVMGALSGSVILLALNTFTLNHTVRVDIPSVLIAMATLLALIYIPKLKEPVIILLAALAGLILKMAV